MSWGSMDNEALFQQVERTVRSLPGVIDYALLDEKFRSDIFDLETTAEMNGAAGGLMPFVNTGVWETFKRKHCFILVVNSSMVILEPTRDVVYICDQKGNTIGEYLTPERQKEMKGRTDVSFLSEDFVLYLDVMPEGEPYFVLPPIPFKFLDCIKGVKNVISGSISTLSDDMVRDRLGYAQTKHWTHLVGFDIDPQ
jgi:hypothetical protein